MTGGGPSVGAMVSWSSSWWFVSVLAGHPEMAELVEGLSTSHAHLRTEIPTAAVLELEMTAMNRMV